MNGSTQSAVYLPVQGAFAGHGDHLRAASRDSVNIESVYDRIICMTSRTKKPSKQQEGDWSKTFAETIVRRNECDPCCSLPLFTNRHRALYNGIYSTRLTIKHVVRWLVHIARVPDPMSQTEIPVIKRPLSKKEAM
jgi:hypothetical protein